MFVILHENSVAASVLDTKDGVIEAISANQLDGLRKMGYLIKELKNANLYGVQQEGFSYCIKYAENGSEIYRGTFPTSNNRNDFYNPEIHITDIISDGSAIYIVLLCHCWCKYDYEFPMVSFQVVKMGTREISKSSDEALRLKLLVATLWGESSKAYVICDRDRYKRTEEETQGDFPSDVAIGYEFRNVPIFNVVLTRNKKLTGISAFAFPESKCTVFGVSVEEYTYGMYIDKYIDRCCIKS